MMVDITPEELEHLIRDREIRAVVREKWASPTVERRANKRILWAAESRALRARAEELAKLRETAGG